MKPRHAVDAGIYGPWSQGRTRDDCRAYRAPPTRRSRGRGRRQKKKQAVVYSRKCGCHCADATRTVVGTTIFPSTKNARCTGTAIDRKRLVPAGVPRTARRFATAPSPTPAAPRRLLLTTSARTAARSDHVLGGSTRRAQRLARRRASARAIQGDRADRGKRGSCGSERVVQIDGITVSVCVARQRRIGAADGVDGVERLHLRRRDRRTWPPVC